LVFLLKALLEPVDDLAVQAPARTTGGADEPFPEFLRHAQEEAIDLSPIQAWLILGRKYRIRNHLIEGRYREVRDPRIWGMMGGMPKLIFTLIAGLVLFAAQSAFGAGGKARIALGDSAPLTVVGVGFPAHEAVVVTVSSKGLKLRKTATSTAAGRFTAGWNRSLQTGGCSPFAISALAADGTHAFFKTVPAGQCAQPVDP
jgi:hypothetical protein